MKTSALVTGAALSLALMPCPTFAKVKAKATKPVASQPAAAPAGPKLIVAISVDQFSADLFAEYRSRFTGGLKRLSDGAVFPSGYQSHAATETCPGHSTILTGDRPARTGIIANNWLDQGATRSDKRIYCAEDETVEGSNAENYTVSPIHLRVPTLGDRMKAANPASRSVAVSGKDRAAVMMGGHNADETWWWGSGAFVSYKGKTAPAAVTAVNTKLEDFLSHSMPAPPLPEACSGKVSAIQVGGHSVGGARGPLEAGDGRGFRTLVAFDEATLEIAGGLAEEMKLGQRGAPDVLAVSLSATDYVGHTFGTEGPEMCAQLLGMDAALDAFFARLDATGVDYAVVLTADHGGHDLPERIDRQAFPAAARAMASITPAALNQAVANDIGYQGFLLAGDAPFGDLYLAKDLPADVREQAIAALRKRLMASGQVEAVLTREEIRAAPKPTLPPSAWTLAQRAAASFDQARSGDLYVVLKPMVTPIIDASTYVATHGSAWDYDRRVPILFWRKGMTGFEQPLQVETVDIMPTLASLIGLSIKPGDIDGRCLDIDASAASNCR